MALFPPSDNMGAGRIRLELAPELINIPLLAFSIVIINVNYDDCAPAGIVLPLELTITAPSPEGYVRKKYSRAKPRTIFFRPDEGGTYLVRLSELAHNEWHGNLKVVISGDSVDPRRRLQ
jgi:hypothetical protein